MWRKGFEGFISRSISVSLAIDKDAAVTSYIRRSEEEGTRYWNPMFMPAI